MAMTGSDQFNMSLDPDLSTFSYPNAYSDYPGPDIFEQSYLSTNQGGYSTDARNNDSMGTAFRDAMDMTKSPHDDLNQFFNESIFTNLTSSPAPGQKYLDLRTQKQLGGFSPASWQRTAAPSPGSWVLGEQETSSLAVITAGEDSGARETVISHGQVTPGDSPASPSKDARSPQKGSKKGRAAAHKSAVTQAKGVESTEPAPPAKKTRKPRKSSKKPPTPEQEALKRETFLKRNREAAYKCRIKKKSQTELIMERAKTLDADNAMKGLEVEQLKREVEALRAMLLPHYRECSDKTLVDYMDGMVNRDSAWANNIAYSTAETEMRSPFGLARPERRESEVVFEMRNFEESMAEMGSRRSSNASSPLSRPGSAGMPTQVPTVCTLDTVAEGGTPPPLNLSA